MSSFVLYVLGFLVLLAGMIYGAYLLNVPQNWIVVGALIVAGFGVMAGVAKTRQPDPPAD
jgi:hypothetical protein